MTTRSSTTGQAGEHLAGLSARCCTVLASILLLAAWRRRGTCDRRTLAVWVPSALTWASLFAPLSVWGKGSVAVLCDRLWLLFCCISGNRRSGNHQRNIAIGDKVDLPGKAPTYAGPCPGCLHAGLEQRPLADLEDGAKYQGQWKGVQRHGHGILFMGDGAKYEGSFEGDHAHGSGTFTSARGDTYAGQWNKDRRHGFGRLVQADGPTYDGEWFEDVKSGIGMETWPDGTWYQGGFLCGVKHGTGVYSSDRKARYEGQFRRDQMDGEGTYAFPSGRVYTGQWRAGCLNGQGRIEFPTGLVYEGGFYEGVRHGKGTLTWPDGHTQVGEWSRGQQTMPGDNKAAASDPRHDAAGEQRKAASPDGEAARLPRRAARGGA